MNSIINHFYYNFSLFIIIVIVYLYYPFFTKYYLLLYQIILLNQNFYFSIKVLSIIIITIIIIIKKNFNLSISKFLDFLPNSYSCSIDFYQLQISVRNSIQLFFYFFLPVPFHKRLFPKHLGMYFPFLSES